MVEKVHIVVRAVTWRESERFRVRGSGCRFRFVNRLCLRRAQKGKELKGEKRLKGADRCPRRRGRARRSCTGSSGAPSGVWGLRFEVRGVGFRV